MRKLLYIFVIISLSWQSCNIEHHVAKQFIEDGKAVAIMIIEPEMLYKQDNKFTSDSNSSPDISNSLYVQFINDSVFLQEYTITLKEELKKYPFTIYSSKTIDTFLQFPGVKYIFNIEQMVLEEYITKHEAEKVLGTTKYTESFDINAVGLNVWVEFREVDRPDESKKMLYDQTFTSDKIEGDFKRSEKSYDVKYVYIKKTMLLPRVEKLATYAGEKHARYIVDFLISLNNYRQLKDLTDEINYLHYDPFTKKIENSGSKRFYIMY